MGHVSRLLSLYMSLLSRPHGILWPYKSQKKATTKKKKKENTENAREKRGKTGEELKKNRGGK
jgi:hypothetical protein